MAVQIRYMGTKQDLAPKIARVIRDLPPGPCADLFAGMCSVAGALAPSGRAAWCNDVQRYATVVAEALLRSPSPPPSSALFGELLFPAFEKNLELLKRRFSRDLARESSALSKSENWRRYQELADTWRHAGNDERLRDEVAGLSRKPDALPYRLTALTLAHGFFGLRQALELDSLRYAIDEVTRRGRLGPHDSRWALVALLQVASHIATAPGHFAQFLKVRNEATYRLIRRLRLRSPWGQFQLEIERLTPYGNKAWRSRNRVYQGDASSLAGSFANATARPSVVYADPPYSRAQYSRYYHVLETLAAYDYPPSSGAGRYRPERYQTPFSHRARVAAAFDKLAGTVAELGASLVLSYPTNGILYDAGGDPLSVLSRHWRSVKVAAESRSHSTMGGAPGRPRTVVREQIFVATRPR